MKCGFKGLLLLSRQVGQQSGNQRGSDALDVAAELVMEVGCAEDDPLTEERLFAAALPCAGGGPFELRDVQLLDGGLAAILLKEVVERAELLGQLRFADTLREAGVETCPAEDAVARAQHIEAKTDMRRDTIADQLIVHEVRAKAVEDPLVQEVAVSAKEVVVVVASDGFVDEVDWFAFVGTLVLEVETGQQLQVRGQMQIALVKKLVVVRDQVEPVRVHASIGCAVVQQCGAHGAESVGALDGDRQSVEVAAGKRICGAVATAGGNTDARRIPLLRLLALAYQSIFEAIMEAGRGLVLKNGCAVDILIAFLAVIGDAIKAIGVGNAGCVHAVVKRGADCCGTGGLPTHVGHRSAVMVLVHWNRVA